MSLTSEYFLFVFIAACGVLQLAAAYSKLKGMMIFKNRIASYIFAFFAIGGAFGWFFGWDNRLDEKIMRTGLEGAQQFYYFSLAALAALAFTLIISSLVNYRRLTKTKQSGEGEEGLDALKEMTYLEAVKRSFKKGEEDGRCG